MPREIYGQREIYAQYRAEGYADFIPRKEACKILGICIAALQNLMQKGKISRANGKVSLWSLAGYVASMS